ncbi:hypothetical protein CEXT_494201 [Caerostris extrusa]|uniref:Uncharacterized protein n=1 Tax=Caerostris extrusa TaxID=172846 RepID=A0AAV4YFB5_CAEEX|nr:hypothetical protein CEXT_494201 [Caerostris extrusa]
MAKYLRGQNSIRKCFFSRVHRETIEGICQTFSKKNNHPGIQASIVGRLDQIADLAGITLEEHGPDLWLKHNKGQ